MDNMIKNTRENPMKTGKLTPYLTALVAIAIPALSAASEGNWKRGHVYYQMVCTNCHESAPCGPIGPDTRTRAEWDKYLEADSHANGSDSLSYYVSKSFRASIADENKAAAKFADVPEEDLFEDIRAFVMRSAKDGDAPTGCR